MEEEQPPPMVTVRFQVECKIPAVDEAKVKASLEVLGFEVIDTATGVIARVTSCNA